MSNSKLDQIMDIINNHDPNKLPGIDLNFYAKCLISLSDLGLSKINEEHFHKTHLLALIIKEFIKMNNKDLDRTIKVKESNKPRKNV